MRSLNPRTRVGVLAILLFAVLALAGPGECGSPDTARAEICRRAVPAIAPPDAAIEILHVGRGAARDSVRVDYRLRDRPDAAAKARRIVCGFGPGADLTSIATESGRLSGASVYLLKRFFLDAPEAEGAGPETP